MSIDVVYLLRFLIVCNPRPVNKNGNSVNFKKNHFSVFKKPIIIVIVRMLIYIFQYIETYD